MKENEEDRGKRMLSARKVGRRKKVKRKQRKSEENEGKGEESVVTKRKG